MLKKSYIKNNREVIDRYEKLYEEKIDIEYLKQKLREGYFKNEDVESLAYFRVFIDGCMLLFNNEKTENNNLIIQLAKEYKEIFSGNLSNSILKNERKKYKDFIFNKYLQYLNSTSSNDADVKELVNNFKKDTHKFIYLTKGNNNKEIRSKLENIRNSIAHMQYEGNYDNNVKIMKTLSIKNIDGGKLKIEGVVLEEIFHDFVNTLFSNNINRGLPYKISKVIDEKKIFLSATLKTEYIESDGIGIKDINSTMQELFEKQNGKDDEFEKYIDSNSDKFKKEKEYITSLYKENTIKKICKKYKIVENKDLLYTLKFCLDIETELSNCIFHMSILNESIIEYLKTKDEGYLERLNELKEDEVSPFIFKLMFLYLKSINILNYIEESKCLNNQIKVKNINIDGFKINTYCDFCRVLTTGVKTEKGTFKEALRYLKDEYNKKTKEYVLEKFRNSLAHGKINVEISKKGEIIFIFIDEYKGNKGIIEISDDNLKKFVSQKEFYDNI